ncbi:MAG: hypothetical protein Q9203_001819 [Teloschistes exilis]
MLVNIAIEQCTIDDLGVVVLDELHMIDDDHRGYLMELLATKLLSLERNVQIVGISATLPNTQLLAKWLNAKCYENKYKPVPIKEFLVIDNLICPLSTPSAVFRAANAGLAAEQREILAHAYDNRIILVIVATCSLAAGINLPARRVIIDGTRMGRDAIGPAML